MSENENEATTKDTLGTTERTSKENEYSIAEDGNNVERRTNTGFALKWGETINSFRIPIVRSMQFISGIAARNPKITSRGIILFSFTLFVLGLFTNFSVDVDEDILWTPRDARPVKHRDWIEDFSGFVKEPRYFLMFFHNNGGNILGYEQVSRVFETVDAIRSLPDYSEVCAAHNSGDCEVQGIVSFWNDSSAVFNEVESVEEMIQAMSKPRYPDGTPVAENNVMGFPERNENGDLVSVQAFTVRIDLPDTDAAEEFETAALDVVFDMAKLIESDNTVKMKLEVQAERSFGDEFERAIVNDIPLVPIVFIIMSIFTCIIFAKRDKVQSRAMLGFSAVGSVFLSLMSGYGLMFLTGVPFTSMTQILPFIIFGIGLDDAFIIAGSYGRTDKTKDPVDRINDTFEDVGLSIALTKFTSTLAFGLGCLSTIPAVFWLCLYAFPTIVFVLLYQTTFFAACIVLDEHRIQQRRRDCISCFRVDLVEQGHEAGQSETSNEENESIADRIMFWYAKKLMQPWVKVVVLVTFAGLLGVCAHSTSQLKQQFEFTDVVPAGSYVTDFFNAFDTYTARSEVAPQVYFRYVNQSDETVQEMMDKYVDTLFEIKAIVTQPEFFWLRSFRNFTAQSIDITSKPFPDQISAFLDDPVYFELYKDDIVLNDAGYITASRCTINMDNLDLEDVKAQVDALIDQRDVTKSQPVNQGTDDWAFFTYDGIYQIWEFFSASVDELIFTTIIGVVAVTSVAFVFIPHWTASIFILPLICTLYVDLLGVMQWAGVTVNAVSYISLVMSIGLLVDYIMHVLVRYYESTEKTREEKTVDMLRTMGASVLTGAVSTFLGVLPLAFSTSEIFQTVFFAFVGLVTVGASHGLIVLPVVLSIVGPIDTLGSAEAASTAGEKKSELEENA